MHAAAPSFHVTGGTTPPSTHASRGGGQPADYPAPRPTRGSAPCHNAPSYVERQADRDLYDGLARGDFCYVLTARQVDKSSLMARTAHRLREEGVAVAVLDLAGMSQDLSPEQWYDGLREMLGEQLDLEVAMGDFWLERSRLGPLQRWMTALREVILTHVPGRIAVFIDGIDLVRSLPFSTDEFFAGIRQCYNRRGEDPDFARLTFCLVGRMSPADLIRDTRTTAFNVGRRIELTDWTEAAAGQSSLAQRLCRAVVERRATSDDLAAYKVLGRWSMVFGGWCLLLGRSSVLVGRGSCVLGRWSMAVGHCSMAVGHWSMIAARGSWVDTLYDRPYLSPTGDDAVARWRVPRSPG